LYVGEIVTPIVKVGLMIGLGSAFGLIGVVFGAMLGSVSDFFIITTMFLLAKTED
jgi:hypothetical protein